MYQDWSFCVNDREGCAAADFSEGELGPGRLLRIQPGDPLDDVKVAVGADEVRQAIVQHGGCVDGVPSCDLCPVAVNQVEGPMHIRQGYREHLSRYLIHSQPRQVQPSLEFTDGTIAV